MKYRGIILGLAGMALISLSVVQFGTSRSAPSKKKGAECASCTVPKGAIPADCLSFVQVELGQSMQLVKSDGTQLIGTWEADFGQVLADGTYVAPRNIAAPGVDRIQFWGEMDPNAPAFTVFVQLMPSTRTPRPDSETLDIIAPVEEPETPETGLGQRSLQLSGEDQAEQMEVTTAEDVMMTPTTTVDLPTVQVGQQTGYLVPVVNTEGGTPTEIAMLISYPGGGQVGRKCGIFPPPVGECRGTGSRLVDGPVKWIRKEWKNASKPFEVSGSIAGSVGLTVGTKVVVDYTYRRVIKFRYSDIYHCIDDKWVYMGTQICHWFGYEYASFSPGYGVWFFFPRNGKAVVEFGPEQCVLYEK